MTRAEHWDEAYTSRGIDGVSWHQDVPAVSLELVDALDVPRDAAVVDIGGGGSFLAEELVARGFTDVTVLDFSATALDAARGRLPADAPVRYARADLFEWEPNRRFDLWHDRAVFHFLIEDRDRDRYLATLKAVLRPGGTLILGTFAADGPEICSGLPVCRYSAGELADGLGAEFAVVATRREVHVTPRGVMQPFTWVAGTLG